mmetsp:Transcript_37026/g.85475  ORF Transcript_37026/g.85475 Transcript_37026/m.85475 type:complete len:546 (-) Transcript_37026:16-1653(-)
MRLRRRGIWLLAITSIAVVSLFVLWMRQSCSCDSTCEAVGVCCPTVGVACPSGDTLPEDAAFLDHGSEISHWRKGGQGYSSDDPFMEDAMAAVADEAEYGAAYGQGGTALKVANASTLVQDRCTTQCRFNLTCDAFVRLDPSRFTCEKLREMWGCQCAGCLCQNAVERRSHPSRDSPVLLRFSRRTHPRALCLDGSSAGMYLRPGSSKHILVYFAPGGWCYDDHCSPNPLETLRACKERSRSVLGSSSRWTTYWKDKKGYLSPSPRDNPLFHNWTLVVVPYCDGTSFSGKATVKGIHFHGKDILNAVVVELQRMGARKANKVVLTGASAGATALFYHADAIKNRLALQMGEVVAIADAGFFLNRKVKGNRHTCWPQQFRSVMKASGACKTLHPACLQRFPQDPCRCLFPEYFADLIKTRFMIVQSLMDYSEIRYSLGVDCSLSGPRACGISEGSNKLLRLLRKDHTKSWHRLIRKPGNGLFAPNCVAHIMARFWNALSLKAQQRQIQMVAIVKRWLEAKPPTWGNARLTFEEAPSKDGRILPCNR